MALPFSFVPAHMTELNGDGLRCSIAPFNRKQGFEPRGRRREEPLERNSGGCVNERRMKRPLCSPLQPAVLNLCASSESRLEASRLDSSPHDSANSPTLRVFILICHVVRSVITLSYTYTCICLPPPSSSYGSILITGVHREIHLTSAN